jgi:hypothetical protein
MKRKLKLIAVAVCLFVAFLMPCQKASAADDIAANMLIYIGTDTKVYESPDESASIVGELGEGTGVIAKEDPDNGWVKVKYQDIVGYVKIGTIAGQDTADLNQEFEEISNDNRLIFEIMEYTKSQKLQNIIWGVIIGGLVVALFAVGIITGLNRNKRNGNK